MFYRGLGRPQGMAFDREVESICRCVFCRAARDRAHLAAGPRGACAERIRPCRTWRCCRAGRAILAANSALFTLDWNVHGLPLLGLDSQLLHGNLAVVRPLT